MHIKDSTQQTENYSPISLLCIIWKDLERRVCIKLNNHVKQFINPLQHGFSLRNRSCTTQLLSVFNAISQKLDKNIETEVIILDLAKAFDSVYH